jgi:uncharacterized membrane protein
MSDRLVMVGVALVFVGFSIVFIGCPLAMVLAGPKRWLTDAWVMPALVGLHVVGLGMLLMFGAMLADCLRAQRKREPVARSCQPSPPITGET